MADTNDQAVDTTEDTGTDVDETTESGEGTSTTQEKTTESPDAKATRLLRQTNQARKKLGLPPLIEALIEKPTAKANQPKGFDYAEKAYLKAEGIDRSEFEWVEQQMKESGFKDIDQLLTNNYFQSQLKERREHTATAKAVPNNTSRSNQGNVDEVDVWLTKVEAGTATINQIPNAKLRQKVVNARMALKSGGGPFYNS